MNMIIQYTQYSIYSINGLSTWRLGLGIHDYSLEVVKSVISTLHTVVIFYSGMAVILVNSTLYTVNERMYL
jgi:hypothetical protein